ncbi:MAG: PRC-barrel domain-containing protein [Gammaproteobacteria bacterium]
MDAGTARSVRVRDAGMATAMWLAGALCLAIGAEAFAAGNDRAAREMPAKRATPGDAPRTSIVRASDYIGKPVRNLQDETLGEIVDLAIDGPQGRVVYAVMAAGGFLGLGQTLYAMPLRELRKPAGDNYVVLDLSPAALERQPGFDGDHWPEDANMKAFSQGRRDAPADTEVRDDAASPGASAPPR